MRFNIVILFLSTVTLTACGANFNSIYRSEDIGRDTHVISQDAKQRVLIKQRHVKKKVLQEI
jgi:hypothetical protein